MDLARPLAVVTPTVDGDVLAVLAGARAPFTGRHVHQVAGRHSERGVRNALHRLSEQGIVTRERVGSSDQFALNRSHLAAPHIEALAGLRRAFLERISAEVAAWIVPAEYVALFGSAATGLMRADSDIDLLVVRIAAINADHDTWRSQLDRLTEDITGWTGNDARVLELAAAEVAEGLASDELVLVDIREHGLTLYGPTAYLHAPRKTPKGSRRG